MSLRGQRVLAALFLVCLVGEVGAGKVYRLSNSIKEGQLSILLHHYLRATAANIELFIPAAPAYPRKSACAGNLHTDLATLFPGRGVQSK
jgi:hypothetical protein